MNWPLTLKTEIPEEGFQLAIKMSQMSVNLLNRMMIYVDVYAKNMKTMLIV